MERDVPINRDVFPNLRVQLFPNLRVQPFRLFSEEESPLQGELLPLPRGLGGMVDMGGMAVARVGGMNDDDDVSTTLDDDEEEEEEPQWMNDDAGADYVEDVSENYSSMFGALADTVMGRRDMVILS
jgi:hypothetical protein